MKSHRSLALLITLLLSVFALALPARSATAAGIRYAAPSSKGTGNCSSWANACTLQTALTGANPGDQIWVMEGTHLPGTTREDTFQLRNGIAIFGGFAGNEDSLSDRDFINNETILSGNIGDPDFYSDNSYHVVTGSGTDATAILDGFTVTEGYANGPTTDSYGGGMYNENGSPTVSKVTFIENHSYDDYGGGMYNDASSPTLNNVAFISNSAYSGGGMYNANDSRPTLTSVSFIDNWTLMLGGGGMRNDASCPTLIDVNFFGNTTSGSGGGMQTFGGFGGPDCSPMLINVTFSGNWSDYGGGGMSNDRSDPILMNVTFSDNSAKYGGAIYNYNSDPLLIHVTISHNDAYQDEGGGIYNVNGSDPALYNSILWGNTGTPPQYAQVYNASPDSTIDYSVVQGGCPEDSICDHLITADPKLGELGDNGGFTPTVPLLPGSSAIDTASSEFCPEFDQRGVERPQGLRCDIGAFEVISNLKFGFLPLVVR